MMPYINDIQNFYFIGIAGDGMSALAQYLKGMGKNVFGSDRQFIKEEKTKRQVLLEALDIKCYPQDTSGLENNIDIVVISSAIEPTIPEYKSVLDKNIPVIMRSDLLADICKTKKTIAVAGTSGKSTVTAMIYHIMEYSGIKPSLITGAGLVSIIEKGKIGNAVYRDGDYLIIEADESDGSIVKYKPEIGIILNIDKDHKELQELEILFKTFASNCKKLIVNNNLKRTKSLSSNIDHDFGYEACGYEISSFEKDGFNIQFKINDVRFKINQLGKHNAENAAAAAAACHLSGIPPEESSEALNNYKGIYRRHQIIYNSKEFTLIDDYAHNPAKLAASIAACQFKNRKLIVWFQPHGYKPTKFLRDEFVNEICMILREKDEIWMSEIYYAGGTVQKDISSEELINDILKKGKEAFYIKSRNVLPKKLKNRISSNTIILLAGARDPSLKDFAEFVKNELIN